MDPNSVSGTLGTFLASIPGGRIGYVSSPSNSTSPLALAQAGMPGKSPNKPTGINVPGGAPLGTTSQINKVSGWDTFWADFYKIPGTSKAADKVISAGAVVEKAKADAVESIKFGLTWGPALVLGVVILYFFWPLFLRRG